MAGGRRIVLFAPVVEHATIYIRLNDILLLTTSLVLRGFKTPIADEYGHANSAWHCAHHAAGTIWAESAWRHGFDEAYFHLVNKVSIGDWGLGRRGEGEKAKYRPRGACHG